MGTHDPTDDGRHLTDATTAVELIEEQAEERIRRVWHDGRWFFSVVDVIAVLTESPNPGVYWRVLKLRLKDEGGNEAVTKCNRLKMTAADGKQRLTDAADTETLLRIIQSVPSPKAEPIKQWLAKVGARRVEEITQPLAPSQVASEIAHLERPPESAPAMEWARYHELMAALYRRQAAYEVRLKAHEPRLSVIDTTLAQHDAELGELHSRVESLEAGMQMLPEILERLGPEALTPEHQRTVQNAVKRLHEVGGYAYATIYVELGQHFHVAKYDQIPEARWEEIAEWFRVRLDAAERRRSR
jgi:BRO family, N-terminal domain